MPAEGKVYRLRYRLLEQRESKVRKPLLTIKKGEDAQAGSTKGRGCASRLDQRERMRKQARPKGEDFIACSHRARVRVLMLTHSYE